MAAKIRKDKELDKSGSKNQKGQGVGQVWQQKSERTKSWTSVAAKIRKDKELDKCGRLAVDEHVKETLHTICSSTRSGTCMGQ